MSQIKQLIDQDERIVYCKKQSKVLFKNLKKTQLDIKLMQCQIKVAQEMGYQDWFDLYNLVKNEIEKNLENQLANQDNNEVSNIFELLLEQALKADATDIHIESLENKNTISIRINGELKHLSDITAKETYQAAEDIYYSLYYGLFNYKDSKSYQENKISLFNPYDFQQMGTLFDINNYNLTIDYQSIPLMTRDNRGFHITVKIKDKSKYQRNNTLSDLGYSQSQIKLLEEQVKRPVGSIVIGGVTGSGMRTTLKSMLEASIKYNKNYNIVSIADPHLYDLDNVKQIPVLHSNEDFKNNPDMPLYRSINAVKRMHADFVFIDKLKGNLPVKAYKDLCFSGINVTASVTAKSSIDIIQQFKNYGLNNESLASEFFLNVIVHQEIMPKVCKHCAISVNHLFEQNDIIEKNIKQKILSLLKTIEYKYIVNNINNILIRNENGCKHCHNMGIEGSTVCAEVIEVNNVMRDLILKNKLIELYDYYKSLSDNHLESNNLQGKTIVEHALHKMLQGIICPTDIIRKFGNHLK